MSNKQFSRRRKTQRFRPSGGMKNQLKQEEPAEKGRADIEDGCVLDEPVYEKQHEAEILAAENEAAGIKPESETVTEKGTEAKPKKPVEEKGVVASVKRAARKIIRKLLLCKNSRIGDPLPVRVKRAHEALVRSFSLPRD